MEKRPEKFFRGGFWFYVGKVFTTLFACMLFIFGGIAPIFIGVIFLFRLIPSVHSSIGWISFLIVIGCFGSCTAIYWIISNPEIAVSPNYLWFRHIGFWQKIRWIDVGTIDLRDFNGEDGIYIFSDRLPIYQHLSTFNFGPRANVARLPTNRRKGRALFVSPGLRNYDELVETLSKLRWQAMQRRHLEKMRHRT